MKEALKVIAIFLLLLGFSCKKPNPFQKKLQDLKAKIEQHQVINNKLEKEYDEASVTKKKRLARKIDANNKKIQILSKELYKLTSGTQKRVLKSISNEAKRRLKDD